MGIDTVGVLMGAGLGSLDYIDFLSVPMNISTVVVIIQNKSNNNVRLVKETPT